MLKAKEKKAKTPLDLNNLANEFAKIGIKLEFPKAGEKQIKKALIEKWNLNNVQEKWERQKLLKKS